MKALKNSVMNTVHDIVQLISIHGDACFLIPWHLVLSTQKVRFKESLFLLCLSQSRYIRKVRFMRLWSSWMHVKAQKYMFKRKSEQSGLIYKRCTGRNNLIMLQSMVYSYKCTPLMHKYDYIQAKATCMLQSTIMICLAPWDYFLWWINRGLQKINCRKKPQRKLTSYTV